MTLTQAQTKVDQLMKTLKDNHNIIDRLENDLQAKKTKLANEYTGKMKGPNEAIESAAQELETICEKHREGLFADGTIVNMYGAVGYRKLPPSVGVADENAAIAWLRKQKKAIFGTFLKVKESVDKTAIKKALSDGAVKDAELAKAGIEVNADGEKWGYAIGKKTI